MRQQEESLSGVNLTQERLRCPFNFIDNAKNASPQIVYSPERDLTALSINLVVMDFVNKSGRHRVIETFSPGQTLAMLTESKKENSLTGVIPLFLEM